MYLVTHAGYPVTLHKTHSAAEATMKKLVEETNLHPDNLMIRFLMVADDEPEYVNNEEWN
jgi:hypothetical protein